MDIWHYDALGAYSDVRDNPGEFTWGKNFLRVAGDGRRRGKSSSRTIYPGWYRGRNVHIHDKIRTNPTAEVGHEFTSQLFFDEAVTNVVETSRPFARHVANHRPTGARLAAAPARCSSSFRDCAQIHKPLAAFIHAFTRPACGQAIPTRISYSFGSFGTAVGWSERPSISTLPAPPHA